MSDLQKKKFIQKEIDQLQSSANRIALLFIIRDAEQEGGIHGYGISDALATKTYGELDGSNATYYAILRQMRIDGLVEQFEIAGDVRKYYRLTSDGQEACETLWNYWHHYYELIKNIKEKK